MYLYTVMEERGETLAAAWTQDGPLYRLADLGVSYGSMLELIEHMTLAELRTLSPAGKTPLEPGTYGLLAPIPRPRQDVLCLGINYADHAVESARFHEQSFLLNREKATYFSKRAYETIGSGDPIPSYEGLVTELDYEVELGVVIGKDCKKVSENEAPNYIFGYTIVNDVSARNLQTEHNQWYFGKSLDGFAPMGPCIVTADEIAFPPALDISSTVNGELRQNSNTDHLLHSVAEIISELSQGMTLRAGTIIATGTPAGVGMGFTPPKFLKKGDVVTCEIKGIGKLTNTVE